MKTKILVLITFLIAIFFFGKWAWNVWPRYEIQRRIIEYKCEGNIFDYSCPDTEYSDLYFEAFYWHQKGGRDWFLGPRKGIKDAFCDEDAHTCYVKQKIRVN